MSELVCNRRCAASLFCKIDRIDNGSLYTLFRKIRIHRTMIYYRKTTILWVELIIDSTELCEVLRKLEVAESGVHGAVELLRVVVRLILASVPFESFSTLADQSVTLVLWSKRRNTGSAVLTTTGRIVIGDKLVTVGATESLWTAEPSETVASLSDQNRCSVVAEFVALNTVPVPENKQLIGKNQKIITNLSHSISILNPINGKHNVFSLIVILLVFHLSDFITKSVIPNRLIFPEWIQTIPDFPNVTGTFRRDHSWFGSVVKLKTLRFVGK